jgi:hypothetical protein
MTVHAYIHEQLAAAHRRDLLETAQHARGAAQTRDHERRQFRFPALRRTRPSRPAVEPCLCTASRPVAAR